MRQGPKENETYNFMARPKNEKKFVLVVNTDRSNKLQWTEEYRLPLQQFTIITKV